MKIIIKRLKVDFISRQQASAVIGGFIKQVLKNNLCICFLTL